MTNKKQEKQNLQSEIDRLNQRLRWVEQELFCRRDKYE